MSSPFQQDLISSRAQGSQTPVEITEEVEQGPVPLVSRSLRPVCPPYCGMPGKSIVSSGIHISLLTVQHCLDVAFLLSTYQAARAPRRPAALGRPGDRWSTAPHIHPWLRWGHPVCASRLGALHILTQGADASTAPGAANP